MLFASCVSVLVPQLGSECLALDTAYGGKHVPAESCVCRDRGRRVQGTGIVCFVWRETRGGGRDKIPGSSPGRGTLFVLSCASEQVYQVEVSRRLSSLTERASCWALGLLEGRGLSGDPTWDLGKLVKACSMGPTQHLLSPLLIFFFFYVQKTFYI